MANKKILTGTYGAGYTLSAGYTALSITSTGVVDGVAGGAGAYGGGAGDAGGIGVFIGFNAKVTNDGAIVGGAGGVGGDAMQKGGAGGVGGAGIVLTTNRGRLVNTGTISGGLGGAGGAGSSGGAGGVGGAGVVLRAAGTVTNTGAITGGQGGAGAFGATDGVRGDGVMLTAGGFVTNGNVVDHTALIGGYVGVYAGPTGAAMVTNYGTIRGRGGVAVEFKSASDRLIAEAGSTFIGVADGGGGTLELAGGSGTITGLGGGGTISGNVALTFSGFGSYVINGGAWTLAGVTTLTSDHNLTNDSSLAIADQGTLALEGTIVNNGGITLAASGTLSIGSAGATLFGDGSGQVFLGLSNAGGQIIGTGTLTNLSDDIVGSGLVGGPSLVVINGADGGIFGDGSAGLILDTGLNTIANAGGIGAEFGNLTVKSAIDNTGRLDAFHGTLTLEVAVTGTGFATVDEKGTLNFTSDFNQNVFFFGKRGSLELARSQKYTATLSGFSMGGRSYLDLVDIGFVSPGEATYSGTATSGVLTVTDGTNTSRINLTGNYLGSHFRATSDGHGGTMITTKPTPVFSLPSSSLSFGACVAHRFIAIMASLRGSDGAVVHAAEPWSQRDAVLVKPHAAPT